MPGTIAGTCKALEQPAIIEPVEGGGELAQRGLVLARSLVGPQAEVVPFRILNPPSGEMRVIRKGTTVGTIAAVEVDSVILPGPGHGDGHG